MDTPSSTRHNTAATIVMWTALGVAVAALALWSLNVIEPPAVIMGGATAIIIILAAARHRNRADK